MEYETIAFVNGIAALICLIIFVFGVISNNGDKR